MVQRKYNQKTKFFENKKYEIVWQISKIKNFCMGLYENNMRFDIFYEIVWGWLSTT